MSARLDLEGKTIGNIKVLRFSHNQKTQGMWICICPKCELEFRASSSNLVNQKPSGCSKCRGKKLGFKENDQEIRSMYLDFVLIDSICNKFNLTRQNVYRSLRRTNTPTSRKMTADEQRLLYNYKLGGIGFNVLCRHFNLSEQALRASIKRVEIKIKIEKEQNG